MQVHIAFHNDSRLCAGWVWCPLDCVGVGYGCWVLWMGLFVFLRHCRTQMMSPASSSKHGKTHKDWNEWVWHKCMQMHMHAQLHTHTLYLSVTLYSIAGLHPSKLSKINSSRFLFLFRVNRWWKYITRFNTEIAQSAELYAWLFSLFWMACADQSFACLFK